MESIRVLQDTFEQLYALSFPMGQYLDSHLPKLEKDWFKKLFLEEESNPENYRSKSCASDLDIYYQAKLLNKFWYKLKKLFPEESHFYEDSNKQLISKRQFSVTASASNHRSPIRGLGGVYLKPHFVIR